MSRGSPPIVAGTVEVNSASHSIPTVNGVPHGSTVGRTFTPEFAADLAWGYDQAELGAFREHAGKNVAILNKRVVGAEPNWGHLREEVARQYGVDEERMVVIWIHEADVVPSKVGA